MEIPAIEVAYSSSSITESSTVGTIQSSTATTIAEQPATSEIDLLETHDSDGDYSWDEAKVVEITLADDASSAAS